MPEWPDCIKTVYVLCNPKYERKRFERLIPHCLFRGIPKERLKLCGPTWGSELTPELIFKVYDPFLVRGRLPNFSFKAQRLTLSELSLCLNFFNAISSAVKGDIADDDAIIVFESDVWLRRDFMARINDVIRDASGTEWDYISLSEGVGTRPPVFQKESYNLPTRVVDPPHHYVFRCCDSMVLRGKFLKKLVRTFIPFKECLDWELNFQMLLHGGKSLWADPPLVEQGTCYSREKTTLDS